MRVMIARWADAYLEWFAGRYIKWGVAVLFIAALVYTLVPLSTVGVAAGIFYIVCGLLPTLPLFLIMLSFVQLWTPMTHQGGSLSSKKESKSFFLGLLGGIVGMVILVATGSAAMVGLQLLGLVFNYGRQLAFLLVWIMSISGLIDLTQRRVKRLRGVSTQAS